METASRVLRFAGGDGRKGESGLDFRCGRWSSCDLRACIDGAAMNVRINLSGLKDEQTEGDSAGKNGEIGAESEARYQDVRNMVENKL